MKSFDKNFGDLRRSRGLSQQDLADELSRYGHMKISRAAVSAWECGIRTPQRSTLELIADYFDVDLNWLLGRVEDPVSDFPEITLIARAGQRMTAEQRDLLLRWARLTFPDAFSRDRDDE